MKLISATFKNFRLLKDLTLEFSTDEKKPLTVIRAANETGKTTCEYGLIWALYGSKALPGKNEFSLFPADLKSKGERKAEIAVEIEFRTEHSRGFGKGSHNLGSSDYRLIRSCVEYANTESGIQRESEHRRMFEISPSGSKRLDSEETERVIENSLPASLKDVYFTDGDSAMSFIEAAAARGVKRKRVSGAIEALLAIDALNTTVKHLDKVSKSFGQEMDNTDYTAALERLNDRIGGWTEDISEWEEQSSIFEDQKKSGEKELRTTRAQLEEALKLGDKEKLIDEMRSTMRQIKNYEINAKTELQQIASLTCNKQTSKIFLGALASKAKDLLYNLNEEKQLPKVNIPILEELLDSKSCFCGADLRKDSEEGRTRRAKIEEAISSSQESDMIQECATSLFYRVRSEAFDITENNWIKDYTAQQGMYQNTVSSLRTAERKYSELDSSIKDLNDRMVNQLKEQEETLANSIAKINRLLGAKATQIKDATGRKKEAEEERTKIEKRLGKIDSSAGKLNLSRYAQSIFKSIIDRMKDEELQKVSAEMNRIFLEMIGADPVRNDLTLITEARLTDDYDIVVFGPGRHQLDPDQDINGASRRAITLAFILALTKVSEVEAPNVIDTPLGMMSGYVKQSVLLQTIKEGSQTILFLTHDEIKGVEEVLDQYAGKVCTLTNPAHYPKILKNEPGVKDARIIKCACNHNQVCEICERKKVETA